MMEQVSDGAGIYEPRQSVGGSGFLNIYDPSSGHTAIVTDPRKSGEQTQNLCPA